MKKEKILLILLLIIFFAINYSFFDSLLIQAFVDYEEGIVERVIDGDTVVINGSSIRLLGINSPEKGEPFSLKSKEFLEEKILGENVRIYFDVEKFDRYKRKLGYIFYEGSNINLESVREGYSNYYFPSGKRKYYSEFVGAWTNCLEEGKNLCKKSAEKCISLDKWDIGNQEVVLKNICSKEVNLNGWSIKDEGRKKYVFDDKILKQGEKIVLTLEHWDEKYVWTKSGDSLILRDSNYEIVLFESY